MSRFVLSLAAAAAVTLASSVAVNGTGSPAPAEAAQRSTPTAREDQLAVIVNLSNPTEDVSLKELRNIAMLQRTHWPNGRKVTVALHEPGPAERRAVLTRVYRMTEAGFTRYFLQATFTGQISVGPRLLTTSEGVRRFVVNVPGAVGFVRLTDADASVKTLRVEGRMPGTPDYPLTVGDDAQP